MEENIYIFNLCVLYLNLNRITEWLFDFLFLLCSSRWNDWIWKWIFWVRSVRQKLIKKYFIVFSFFCGIPFLWTQSFCSFIFIFVLVPSLLQPMTVTALCVCVRVLHESAVACTDFNHSSLLQWFFNTTNQMNAQQCINVIKNGNWYALLGHSSCELSFISYFPHRLTIDFQFRHNHISNAPLFYEIIKRNKCQTKCK